MNCPVCGSISRNKGGSPNGGILWIAEDTGSANECYDLYTLEFVCDKGHTFYISQDVLKKAGIEVEAAVKGWRQR